jgi:hypothetical protein
VQNRITVLDLPLLPEEYTIALQEYEDFQFNVSQNYEGVRLLIDAALVIPSSIRLFAGKVGGLFKDLRAAEKTAPLRVQAEQQQLTKEELWVDPREIRFSQRSAGGGLPPRAPQLRESLKRGWDPAQGPIDVVQTQKGLTTFDNTRVAIAQEFGIDAMTARVRSLSEALPPGFAEARGLTRQAERLGLPRPTTWGDALRIRTMKNGLPLEGTPNRPSMPP